MDNDEAISALGLLSRMRFACGDNGLRMQDELEEYLRGLKRDSDALAKLRAEIAGLAEKWRDPHENRDYSAPFRIAQLKTADELVALLRLPAGEA